VLGNHELNLLRDDLKHGNAWFVAPKHEEQSPGGAFAHSRVVDGHRKGEILEFLETLPLALERPDLRVVHAAWHTKAIRDLRSFDAASTVDAFTHFEALIEKEDQKKGLADRARQEKESWRSRLTSPDTPVPLLPAVAEWDTLRQMGNPLRVLTSGVERPAARPFYSSGKWRMCDRVPWWMDYDQRPRVVIGHYWRRWRPVTASAHGDSEPALFEGTAPADWLGPQGKVYCVDFSVGARYEERRKNVARFDTALLALRLPEGQLTFDQEA
jgi:hypothetical protein